MAKRTAKRVYRELTAYERLRLETARREIEVQREQIIARGRIAKRAWLAMRAQVTEAVAALRAERERLGLSLADIEERSGIRRSALPRLENDANANPTLLTLERYAVAVELQLSCSLHSLNDGS